MRKVAVVVGFKDRTNGGDGVTHGFLHASIILRKDRRLSVILFRHRAPRC